MRWIQALTALVVLALAGGCEPPSERPAPLVVLIELDGAGLDLVDELRSEGRLPNLDRLIEGGASGPLQSWPSRRVMGNSARRQLASPIVWTSVATGKIPEKHGIRDFVLPIPGTASAWIGSEQDPARASVVLPELESDASYALKLRMHAFAPLGEQPVDVIWNGSRIATLPMPVDWATLEVALPPGESRKGMNRLELVIERQGQPSDDGVSTDHRRLAAELAFVQLVDATGRVVFSFDPAVFPERFERGFYPARGRLTEVQSLHYRAKPVWTLLGEAEIPVGIIGHWGTWPAYPVNGFLVSSRMGVREQRTGSDRLTWPDDLASEIEPLAPVVQDLEPELDELHVSECKPRFIDQQSVLKKILVQDTYYVRLAKKLLAARRAGLYTVYLRSIDVAGHVALQWRYGAPIPAGCPETIRDVMDAVYVRIDAWIGEILATLPDDATVLVVSDHGMQSLSGVGQHAPFGLFIAKGEAFRERSQVHGSTVLDVAPTLMYLFDQPVPLDMDGKVLTSVFADAFLEATPLRFADVDTSIVPPMSSSTDASEEALDELRALGYIE